jgi:tetratricopeptide (TPR) repeat protein
MSWKDANNYCASLKLGGYTGWRLPTLDEVKAITYLQGVTPGYGDPYTGLEFKGGISGSDSFIIWTSTLSRVDGAWTVLIGDPLGAAPFNTNLLTDTLFVICTRHMESDLLQIATDAQVHSPISDLQTLKDYALLAKARLAFQSGQYQESIRQAKNALLVKPDFAPAYWGIGISYGKLGQWDLAITNLKAALKIDKNYDEAKNALKWAKERQSDAKNGKKHKILDPWWN